MAPYFTTGWTSVTISLTSLIWLIALLYRADRLKEDEALKPKKNDHYQLDPGIGDLPVSLCLFRRPPALA